MKLSYLALLPLPLSASLAGSYSVQGNDPLHSPYSGEATITQDGNVFTAWWYYSDGTSDMGTGVLNQNQIAFIYQGNEHPKDSGVISYRVVNNQLVGVWVPLNESTAGAETLRPR